MNAGKAFFDTNVLLYMHSAADLRKQGRAQEVFEECLDSGRLVLSELALLRWLVEKRFGPIPPKTGA